MTPRRPDQEPLTRERIVEAALALVDEHGLDGLTMRELGATLDVDASTLYYHIPNKAALHGMVAEAVMADHDLSSLDPHLPPIERFRDAGRAFRAALLRHPNAVPLMIGHPMRTAVQMRPLEVVLGVLYEAGIDGSRALFVLDSMAAFVLGCVAGEINFRASASEQNDFSALASLPSGEFPYMHRLLGELGPHDLRDYHERMFEYGLDLLARGLLGGSHDDRGTGDPAHEAAAGDGAPKRG